MADEIMAFHERIRKVFLDGQWWFSVVDVVGVLTDSANPRFYWGKMKQRLAQDEGFVEVLTKCQQLKMRSPDGKMRSTDAADTETLLRIIQSIPSPKAEPFKRWLARVGTERIQEEVEPSLAEARLIRTYRRQGSSDDWIRQRMTSIRYRNGVTTEWGLRGAETGQDYAELTDTLSEGKFGITTGQHKEFKGLKPGDNLENSETIMELAIDSLGDATSITLHQARDSQGMPQLQITRTRAIPLDGF